MISPYLAFNGECQEVINFYRSVFPCGEPIIMNYDDYMPEGSKTPPELLRSWIMHGEMEICGTNVWFADEATPFAKGDNIRLSANVPTGTEARAIFDALSADGTVTLPPVETFYSAFHAAVKDKFGITWNIVAEEQPERHENEEGANHE